MKMMKEEVSHDFPCFSSVPSRINVEFGHSICHYGLIQFEIYMSMNDN